MPEVRRANEVAVTKFCQVCKECYFDHDGKWCSCVLSQDEFVNRDYRWLVENGWKVTWKRTWQHRWLQRVYFVVDAIHCGHGEMLRYKSEHNYSVDARFFKNPRMRGPLSDCLRYVGRRAEQIA